MEKFIVKKSPPLEGSVLIGGAKNAALPILAATLLCEGTSVISNVPDLSDIDSMCKILEAIGANVQRKKATVTVTPRIKTQTAPYELLSKMRASFLILGPLLARTGSASLSLPGGCPIGVRPVDLHLKGFAALGAQIKTRHGSVALSAKKLYGTKIYLDFPSVGATENILMAAVLAEGRTVIENAAAEPEIENLAAFLNKAGAKIKGAGSATITVEGVQKLCGAAHSVIPDRIEAGTFMTAAAITRGCVTLRGVACAHLKPVTAKFREIGICVTEEKNKLTVDAGGRFLPVNIKTLPFPGFPTDMQAQMTALMCLCDGTSTVTETVFENRFLHVSELARMGAKIKVEGRCAIIEGVKSISGAQVKAPDLRAGAALVLAGLAAKGDTEVGDIFHIERGYENFAEKLNMLGGRVEKV